MERALRGCAEAGVPETVDLWPTINGRVTGQRASEARISEEPAGEAARRRTQPSQLMPASPLGWVLATLSVLILCAGAYAGSGFVEEPFRLVLPGTVGTVEPGSGEDTSLGQADGGSGDAYGLFRSHVPGGEGPRFGQEIGQSQTADGARVTVGWAYADAESVVVAYTVEDLEGGRRVGGHPAELQPTEGVRLTDQSGTEFRRVDGQGAASPGPHNIIRGPRANSAVFAAEGRIEPGGARRFRLEIPLQQWPVTPLGRGGKTPAPEPVGEPFVFGFDIPVRPVPVFGVDEKATASGITLTLKRVTDSPGRPEAVVCLEPAHGVRGWYPIGEDLNFEAPGQVAGEGNCLEVLLNDPLDGPSSVTVEQVELNPVSKEEEMIRGPWRFEFEVPEVPGS